MTNQVQPLIQRTRPDSGRLFSGHQTEPPQPSARRVGRGAT